MTWPRSSRPSNPGHVSFPTATSSLHCTPLPLSSRKSRYMSIGVMFESMLYLNKSQNTASVYTEGVKLPELDLRCYYFKRFSARPFYKINSHYSSLTIFKYILVFWNFKAQWPLGSWGWRKEDDRKGSKCCLFFFPVSLSATAKNSCNTAVT